MSNNETVAVAVAVPDREECFAYLDALGDICLINMLGAGPHLAKEFDIDDNVARNILTEWMNFK